MGSITYSTVYVQPASNGTSNPYRDEEQCSAGSRVLYIDEAILDCKGKKDNIVDKGNKFFFLGVHRMLVSTSRPCSSIGIVSL